jgi:transcriptional regulator GlxA family with amidase domain
VSAVVLRLCGSKATSSSHFPDENPHLKGNHESHHDRGCNFLREWEEFRSRILSPTEPIGSSEIFAGPTMDPRIAHVASFIRHNYHRRLTLTEMADTVNLSRWRLCHLFKESMGTSPERYLTKVRLETARQLLETEFLTVKEVMNRVGIADASYFARSFKSVYGVTPGKYKDGPKER